MKYFLEISYLGKNYCGWQIQPNAITIQEELEKAFFLVFSEKITINGSSRTDTGVHARQQFAQTIEKEGCICVSQTVICFVNIITIQLVSNKKLNFVTLYLKDLSKIKHIFLKFPKSN